MLDFNDAPSFLEKINALIDEALVQNHANETPRDYLGSSRLGVECQRALQYEFCHHPKDEDRGFSGKLLRIFQAGHVFEDLCIDWLKSAGIILQTCKDDGTQFGFSAAGGRIKGHVDGIVVDAPPSLGFSFPMLWECKSLNDKSWKDTVEKGVRVSKPVYATQMALYQAYMNPSIPGIYQNPCLFTAINKNTAELYHELVPFDAALAQTASDKGVLILKAIEAQELLPRCTKTPTHPACRICAWQDQCWGESP
ncbi:MAG: hypothetical protein ACTSXQ_06230 [Alphaproteobacteria bacterium]